MGYTPTEWATGDVITAEKLNKIEQAIYDLYDGGVPAGYVVVAPKQSVTLTGSETDYVQLTTVDGYEVTGDHLSPNLVVKVNGIFLHNVADQYTYFDGSVTNDVGLTFTDRKLGFIAYEEGEQPVVVAGTYEVVVYALENDPFESPAVLTPIDDKLGV